MFQSVFSSVENCKTALSVISSLRQRNERMSFLRWIITTLCIVHQSRCIFIGHRRVKRLHDVLPSRFSVSPSHDAKGSRVSLSHDNLDLDLSDNVIVAEVAVTRDGKRKYKTQQMVLVPHPLNRFVGVDCPSIRCTHQMPRSLRSVHAHHCYMNHAHCFTFCPLLSMD